MIEDLRQIYGEVFVTSLPDGLEVPWKPLSYGEFIYYSELFREGRLSPSLLEDEIFSKCVANKAVIERIGSQKAGTISAVVEHIMSISGPQGIEDFNEKLEEERKKRDIPFHQVVVTICRAFPSYKPEDIYSMKYEQVMVRLAQAEAILIEARLIAEPIKLYRENEKKQAKRFEAPTEVKRAWENSMKFKDLNAPLPTDSKKEEIHKPAEQLTPPIPNESPVLQKRVNIKDLVYDTIKSENTGDLTPDDRLRKKMLSDVPHIYKDLINKLKKEVVEKKNK